VQAEKKEERIMITLLLRAYLFPKRERTREEWLKRGKRFFLLLFLMFDLGRKEEGGGPKKKGKNPTASSLSSPLSLSHLDPRALLLLLVF